jgi:hypothetical protein
MQVNGSERSKITDTLPCPAGGDKKKFPAGQIAQGWFLLLTGEKKACYSPRYYDKLAIRETLPWRLCDFHMRRRLAVRKGACCDPEIMTNPVRSS